ncbi:hypothetical protein [Synechocystis sp. PCC 7509]|nr:hypothetical protein [Synechocystis sp. PCC 7509]
MATLDTNEYIPTLLQHLRLLKRCFTFKIGDRHYLVDAKGK